jgi:cytochrome c-type biogenesis protein CcmH/NrfF
MRQHELDPWSLVFGVAFLAVSGSYLLTHTTDVHLHWLLALPAGLIVIGIGILAASARRLQRPADDATSEIDVDDDRGMV